MADNISKVAELLKQAAAQLTANCEALPLNDPENRHNDETETTSTTNRNTSTIRQEVGRLFSPYPNNTITRSSSSSRPRPRGRFFGGNSTSTASSKSRPAKWSHKFNCLASPDQDFKPVKETKVQLLKAGLGEKRILFDKTNDAEDFKNTLFEKYPKLVEGGGYELLRSSDRSSLEVIPPSNVGYTAEYLADSCSLGQSVIFVRPLQRELDFTDAESEPSTDCLLEKCLICEESMPVIRLKEHLKTHQNESLPVVKKRRRENAICNYTCIVQNTDSVPEKENKMPCPVCGIHYDENLIESHAAICGEVVHMPKVTTSDSKLFETLTEELSNMKEKIYADAAKYNVSILRKRFIETAMQNLVDIDYNNILNVIFIGEEGVDAGGLTREFFALLFSKSPVFENGAFSIDCDLLNDETFKQIGKAVAYSVLFGNQGPNCLSRYLVNYIIFGTIPKVEDIPEDELPMFVIQAIKDITEAEGNFSDLYATHGDMLETSGFKKIMNDSTKKDAIHALILHFGFYRFLPQTLQFVEGLKLHCVYDVLKNHGEEAIVYFINCETTSTQVIDFFLPSFSLEADEKEDEEMIVYNLHYFVKKLERGKIVTSYINMVDMDCSAEKTLTIKDFLKAITGSPTLVKNLTNCLVQFNHTSTMCSTVNTCAPSITVNQVKKNTEYVFFETSMINIIVGAQDFGVV